MSFQENTDDDYEMNVDDYDGIYYGMNEDIVEGSDTHTERYHVDDLNYGPFGSHDAQPEQRATNAVVSHDIL